jgi:hypothetical protein
MEVGFEDVRMDDSGMRKGERYLRVSGERCLTISLFDELFHARAKKKTATFFNITHTNIYINIST